jgi:putative oxidoreductase
MRGSSIFATDRDRTTILIRLVVGYVFVTEGIQKFVYDDALGTGRFAKIGIPAPEILGPFVGGCEIVFGIGLLLGFAVRVAAVPMIVVMLTALATTKLPVLRDKGLLTFSHEARNDLLMLFGCVFLLIKGAGAFGLDRRLGTRK